MRFLPAIAVISSWLASTDAQSEPARAAIATRRTGAILLDGRLDDAGWRQSPVVDGFVQRSPSYGAAPTQGTTARVVYDAEAIWIAFDCRDSEASEIVAPLARRDQTPESDRVFVYLDGIGDGRSGFEFMVNAAGVQSDAVLFGDTGLDRSWDGVWEAEVRRDVGGWTAEMRIPFRILRFREGRGRAWGMQLRRIVSRTRETIDWQPIPLASATFVSSFGRLEGVETPEGQTPLEFRPYVAGRLGLGRAEGSLAPRDTVSGEIGIDARWVPTPDLSVDATINPDFGQVELDPQVVNLSPYETFFPERRPFFLEGFEVFRTPFTLVHTRRIGEAPDVPEAPEDDPVVEMPETTRIWGAAKVTGEVAEGTSVGVLAARTGSAFAEQQSRDTRCRPWSPRSECGLRAAAPAVFSAARVRRQISGTSTVGLLATVVERADDQDPAVVGSGDWDLRSSGGEWRWAGQFAGSRVDRETEPAFDGWALALSTGRIGGAPLRPDASFQFVGPGFSINDLGFQGRDDRTEGQVGLSLVREAPWGPTRFSNLRVEVDATRNSEGDLLGQDTQISGFAVFQNLWSLHLSTELGQPYVDDRESRGGPDVARPASWETWASFDTDFSKPIFGGGGGGTGRSRGGPFFSQYAWVTVRPIDRLELSLSGSWNHNDGYLRWVATDTDLLEVDHSIFASAETTQAEVTFRALVVVARNLTFQLYAQVLRAVGDHSGYRELVADGEFAQIPGGRADDADFDSTGVSLQGVLRWELLPGSPAFLVARHQLQTDAIPASGSLPVGRDAHDGLGHVLDGGDDVVMAKVTLLYWP